MDTTGALAYIYFDVCAGCGDISIEVGTAYTHKLSALALAI